MEIRNILIIGAGMMGKGIAQVFAAGGDLKICLYDVKDGDVLGGIREEMEELAANGMFPASEIDGRMEKISFTTDKNNDFFKKADLVVECVFEDMDIKRSTFAMLEELCPETAILATNTSVMSPTEISAKLKHKERFVGAHFWNPAFLIPLVEVVKSSHSSDDAANSLIKLLSACGKKPVLCKKDVPGFIANRLQHALWREEIGRAHV